MDLHKPAFLVATLRKKKGMTQAQFAELIGVTQSQVSRWEAGSATPSVDDWLSMATVAPHEDAEVYYMCASMEDSKVASIAKATKTIVDFIRRFDPSRAANLEREIVGIDIDEQLDRATQVLLEISPPEPKAPPVVTLSPDDRKRLDEASRAIEKLDSWLKGDKPK